MAHHSAKTYHPKRVENQCVSIDIIQSHAAIDPVIAKNTINQADDLTALE